MPTLAEMEKMSDHELVSQQGLAHMQVEALLQVRLATRVSTSIDNLRESIDTNAKSSDELSKKVHRLNIVLTWATVVGACAMVAAAIATFLQLYR